MVLIMTVRAWEGLYTSVSIMANLLRLFMNSFSSSFIAASFVSEGGSFSNPERMTYILPEGICSLSLSLWMNFGYALIQKYRVDLGMPITLQALVALLFMDM